ncbi:MAG TPA: hydantoinase B/oxoprolinase family protein [Burkholderiaceae bacterium]|nr:hydantoinase B/oxoprolinase family protein [Burkholderiaceae bacterium]
MDKQVNTARHDIELMWKRMINSVDEAATTLVRTSFSTVIRDFHDYACAIFDSQGRMLAQSTQSTPGLLGILPYTIPNFLKDAAFASAKEGDIFITNDPWLASGHLIDVTVAAPVFRQGELVAYVLVVVHHLNMGGRIATLESRNVYEEGLKIPITPLMQQGNPCETTFRFIRANVMEPDKVIGDIRAQVAACHAAAQRLLDTMDELNESDLIPIGDEIIERSRASMRAAIEDLPDGEYSSAMTLHDIAGHPEPLQLKLRVSIKGSGMQLDFSGTSTQIARAVNVTLNMTRSYSVYPLKCLLDPSVPNNAGCLEPFDIQAPEGSVLNATFPAPTWGRTIIAHMLPELIMQCLAAALPKRVLAGSGSTPLWYGNFSGRYKDGKTFYTVVTFTGGLGARGDRDGISCVSYPANVAHIPVEVVEADSPLLFEVKELAPDSAGAGQYRGGLGQRVVIQVREDIPLQGAILASIRGGRFGVPIQGIQGGEDGPQPCARLNGVDIKLGTQLELKPGDRLLLELPGGGGYGDPALRDHDACLDDVRNGLVSEPEPVGALH